MHEKYHQKKEPNYGISRLRPLARRRFNTSRPDLLLIRSRNPCVFTRFRLLGLKVGIINNYTPKKRSLLLSAPRRRPH